MKRILRLTSLAFLCAFAVASANAQCSNYDGGIDPVNSQDYNDDTQTTPLRKAFGAPIYNEAVDIKFGTLDGTFVRVGDIVAGRTYQILTRSATQYFVTVKKQNGTNLVFGSTPLTFTPATNDSIQIHTNKTACSATFTGLNLQMSCTSCGAPPVNVANNLCGGAIAAGTIYSYTKADPATPSFVLETTSTVLNVSTAYCGGAVGDDDDVWYSFVAPSTGKIVVRHGRIAVTKMAGTNAAPSFIGMGIHSNAACPVTTSALFGGCQNTTTSTNEIEFTGLTSGATYYLRMWSNGALGFVSAPVYLFTSSVIAIELQTWKATPKDKVNQLSWTTASEQNAAQFIIERSANGLGDWTTIGKVKASGSSNIERKYTFNDEGPLSISYYRLKSVEYSGKEEVSKVITVKQNGGKLALIAVSPTPTTEGVTVDLTVSKNSRLTATLTDIVGKIVKTQSYETVEGFNSIRMDLTAIARGAYILSLDDGETTVPQRIIKQ
jgi:hypothetical protein